MNRFLRPSLAAALTAAMFTPAIAEVEIGGTAGLHVFSKTSELGVNDVATADSQRNSALFGLRLGVYFGSLIGVEGEVGLIPSEGREQVYDIWNLTYRGHLVAQFRAANPANKLIPFVLFGGGAIQVVSTDGEGRSNPILKDTDEMLYAGVGAKYRVDNGWGLRLDGRVLFVPASVDGEDMPNEGFTQDYEVLLSIYKEFGRKTVEKIEQPPPDLDPDKDGILGDADKCPAEAEDKDAFQDDDGCPDNDNDGDGVADATDKCPTEPEDKDSFEDEDGCPDLDNDGDGIPDAADKCPIEAEDKDSFQDDDGCPDPDNDADGVLDPQDKCPDQPETRNGFQDEDGCADEIPVKLKKFTGVIAGINFRTNDATLTPGSSATLNRAVAVLKEFGDLKLEIQGHTDDQPIKKGGKYTDNQALSQARAESVKAYFVAKGIEEGRLTAIGYGESQPIAAPTGLKGGKLNAARAKNRRVEFKLVSALTTSTPPPTTGTTPASPDTTSPTTPTTPEQPAPTTPTPAPQQ